MVWAELLLILQALCRSVHQVLGNNMTETLILYNDVGSLLTESFPKMCLEKTFVLPCSTSNASHKFFPFCNSPN